MRATQNQVKSPFPPPLVKRNNSQTMFSRKLCSVLTPVRRPVVDKDDSSSYGKNKNKCSIISMLLRKLRKRQSTCQDSGVCVWVYRNRLADVIGKWNITTLTGRIQNRGRARIPFPKKKFLCFASQRPPNKPLFPPSFFSLSKALPRKEGRRKIRGTARHLLALSCGTF